MALIEYRITVDGEGNATVVQDVVSIDVNDQIRFVSDVPGTAIRFTDGSPFEIETPGPDRVFPVVGTDLQFVVTRPNSSAPELFVPQFQEERRTFRFEIGQLDSDNYFFPWQGPGGFVPDGGLAAAAVGSEREPRRKNGKPEKEK
jgi:hypothetical protein